MAKLIEESRTTTPMSNDEIIEALKAMVFGKQAFERFDAKERETLNRAWNIIDQYENRLKVDMVAMLEELKSNIDELASSYDVPNIYVEIGMKEIENEIQDLIQQKINFLSGL